MDVHKIYWCASSGEEMLSLIGILKITSVCLSEWVSVELWEVSFCSEFLDIVQAFDTNIHPLGQLMASLVDVYLATYVGVGAHMRLLFHAVQELKAYIDKIYPIIR